MAWRPSGVADKHGSSLNLYKQGCVMLENKGKLLQLELGLPANWLWDGRITLDYWGQGYPVISSILNKGRWKERSPCDAMWEKHGQPWLPLKVEDRDMSRGMGMPFKHLSRQENGFTFHVPVKGSVSADSLLLAQWDQCWISELCP